ncbi:MAG: tyrosine-type recombinase/integrase [Desulfovibrio sp.]|nr:tyrosine-type recombinase/integrase [Desulfovibrio sp.]
MDKEKLNILQRGAARHLLTMLVYLACLGGMAFIIDALEKSRFAVVAQRAATQNILPANVLEDFTVFINNTDSSVIFMVFLLILPGVAIGLFLIKLSTKLNIVWPVTLPQAVEFSSATLFSMRRFIPCCFAAIRNRQKPIMCFPPKGASCANEGVTDARQKVVFHTLRHTFASWQVMRGVPLYDVAKLMGRNTIVMTQRYATLPRTDSGRPPWSERYS